MLTKQPNPVDVHVGNRLRSRRKSLRMSQEKLADSVKLTFQQIQKYEKGTNRIGASRLYEIARVLAVPVAYFFEGLEYPKRKTTSETTGSEDLLHTLELLGTREGLELNRAFLQIANPKVRKRVVELVCAISEKQIE